MNRAAMMVPTLCLALAACAGEERRDQEDASGTAGTAGETAPMNPPIPEAAPGVQIDSTTNPGQPGPGASPGI